MQNTRNYPTSKIILAIITIFLITAILVEPSLLIGYRTAAQVHNGRNIQSASHNPPFEILDIPPLARPPASAIKLDPPKLSIVAEDPGATVPDNTVQVTAAGSWLATTKTPWLEIHCATGNCGGSFLIVRFRIDGLKPGNHTGEVMVTAGNDSLILPVSLTTKSVAPTLTDKENTISTSTLKSVPTQRDASPKPTRVPKSQGLMYQNPKNPHRWMLDGKPFHPIGFGDCVYVRGANNEILMGFDGEQKPNFTDLDTYFKAYSDAGFNFLRISVGNCSFPLDLMSENWALMDTYIGKARQYGFQIQFCFFNTNPDTNQLEYVKKSVQRYGKDVAIWEVCNETTVSDASDAAVSVIAKFVKSIDALHRPVTVSHHPNQYPYLRDIPALDLVSPHWYQEDDSEFSLDKDIVDRFVYLKAWGKPVIAGEYGFSSANWSQVSALQMRLASWSAFFNEIGLCFWNTSWNKTYKSEGASNMYLGKQERSFIKVLSDFTRQVPADVKIANITVNKPDAVRAFALNSGNGYFAYLHAFTNHTSQTSGISLSIEPKTAGYATWIEPATGRVLAAGKVSAGRQTLPVPPFLTDVALKVSSSPSTKK